MWTNGRVAPYARVMSDTGTAEQQARATQQARTRQQAPRARALAVLTPQIESATALAEAADAVTAAVEVRVAAEQTEAARRTEYDTQYDACVAQGLTADQLAVMGWDASYGAGPNRSRSRRRASRPGTTASEPAGNMADEPQQPRGFSAGDRRGHADPPSQSAPHQLEAAAT